jgi:AraC family transcriptional regulator
LPAARPILKVALSVGYGSHEAFTRAFHERFGLTPEAIRAQGSFTHLRLTEAQRMDTLPSDMLQPPRFAFVERLRVAGIGARYAQHSIAGIPAQWQRFVPLMDDVRGRIEQTEYGVCTNADEAGTFEYVCGVEVADFEGVPADWSRVEIMQQQYAVFLHSEHISAIRATHQRIWNEWLPASAVQAAAAPDFERYDRSFDPRTGLGGVEIWIPIQAKHAAINERR